MTGHFPILIITGRPAAGKSEVIDFLKKCDPAVRLKIFHIADFEELDDFPYVWETFELDDLMTRFGKPRIWSDEKYWFKDQYVWDLYMERLALDYKKTILNDPAYHQKKTVLIEFARGGEDGIHRALTYLSDQILQKASLLYIKVTHEESLRKNRKRAKPGQENSILYHSLPDDKMEYYYKINDWEKLEAKDPNFIEIKGYKIPYAVFENMPEKTNDTNLLNDELERAIKKIWSLQHHS